MSGMWRYFTSFTRTSPGWTPLSSGWRGGAIQVISAEDVLVGRDRRRCCAPARSCVSSSALCLWTVRAGGRAKAELAA